MDLATQARVYQETRNTTLPFSWLSTRKVCQRWQAYYASLPNQNPENVV